MKRQPRQLDMLVGRLADAKAVRRLPAVASAALSLLIFSVGATSCGGELPETVDFNFHIRPLLSDRCYPCHGPDAGKRQADLRLDQKDGAFAPLDGGLGSHIIKPGEPERSEVYRRITHPDADMRMPPAESKLALSEDEIALIRRWIQQGAEWKDHWSFLPLETVAVPETDDSDWPSSPIDGFVLSRLRQEGISPAPEASRETLIRRVTFDLTGLPPTPDEVDAFASDDSSDAYEQLVDRLLASPRFGERMTVDWLDLARYADTYGYQSDVYRAMWPWRDWVIRAFNENLPYDQFVTCQLAGDLLPDPTRDEVLATAFNRNHRQTNEGGSIEEEFRVEYVADRTETFGAAFLGLTLGCARCHDHKFDPVKQKEYYQLSAFFASIDESGLYSHFTTAVPTPTLLLSSDDEQRRLDELARDIGQAEAELSQLAESRRPAFKAWLSGGGHEPVIPGLVGDFAFESLDGGQAENRADPAKPGKASDDPLLVEGRVGRGLRLSGDNNVTLPLGGFSRNDPFSVALWMNSPDHKDRAVIFHRSRAWTDAGSQGYQLLLEEGRLSAAVIHFWPGNAIGIWAKEPLPTGQWTHVVMTYDGSSRAAGLHLYVNGRLAECDVVRDNLFKDITGGGVEAMTIGQRFRDRGFKNGLVDEFKVFDRELSAVEAAQLHDDNSLAALLNRAVAGPAGDDTESLFRYYLSAVDDEYRGRLAAIRSLRRQRSELLDGVAEIMVMKELPQPRATFVLKRGAYDAPGEQVEPGTPRSLPEFPADAPPNRLGLAKWATDPRHPLTARVAVNRYWQALFGRGFVATPEDFGSQGQLPSHPQLLDWLAVDFVQSGWDVKRLLKEIVTSATYRQSSVSSPEMWTRDPQNILLARGPRHRLSAEMIRDASLFAGGLLVEKIGGPPVKPYQPLGLWEEKSGLAYTRDVGEGSHRRSLYTFWKRTSAPPNMITFDAAQRDVCVVSRQTTATPLQALLLLNDPQHIEAARGLAERSLLAARDPATHDLDIEACIRRLFRTVTGRHPSDRETTVLTSAYQEQLAEFTRAPDAARQFLSIGDHVPDTSLGPAPLAAMAVLAETLMNFDEAVTKR